MSSSLPDANETTSQKRRMEIYAFLIVTAVLMPAIAVATVGTWGLTVWIYQAISGPLVRHRTEACHDRASDAAQCRSPQIHERWVGKPGTRPVAGQRGNRQCSCA